MEMAHFQILVKDDPKVKAIISNLISRLKILLMEDIHVLEAERCARCIKILDEYEGDRDQRHLLLSFCEVLKDSKKGRLTSYYNKWYQHHELDEDDVKDLELNHILKFKKSGDSDEFLRLGENMIHYLNSDDERFLGIYSHLLRSGDQGKRYSRRSGSLLWWEIFEDLVKDDDTMKTIWSMAFHEFKRLNLKERYHFGIWIGLVYWKRKDLIKMSDEPKCFEKMDEERYYEQMKKMTMDEYVIKDFHVNKNHGLDKFATEGAFVPDEDLSMFETGEMYKEYYITDKVNTPSNPKKKKKKRKEESTDKSLAQMFTFRGKEYYVVKDDDPEFISWENFSDVKILQDGVCGGKVCCISVMYEDKRYILKEMRSSMNYGKDYLLVDRCKKFFGLKDMNMKRIRTDKGQIKIDKTKLSFVNNVQIGEKECVYCMMDYWDNLGDIGKNKELLKKEDVKRECLKIRLFDGIFRSSDNILRNILVNTSEELLSIDEGDIYGKRKEIFNKHDWCKSNCSVKMFEEVLEDLLDKKNKKIVQIVKEMIKLDMYHREFFERFMNYDKIVMNDLNIVI
tara:strand:- start:183 stop:1877 length:1695 start_codon:yes stop_codon:yes gene_type:complete